MGPVQQGPDDEPHRDGPPVRVRLIGRAVNTTAAWAPWLWPLLRPAVGRYFDSRAAGWDERTGAPDASHLTALAAGLTRIAGRPERALDLGTGTGVAALLVAREFPTASVRGVDISERMVRLAQRKVGLDPDARIAFRVADAANLPFGNGHFDLVTQLNMPPFFAETARVLGAGGHVVVAASSGERTPFYTPAEVLERGFGRYGLRWVDAGHIAGGTWFVARKGD